MAENSRIEDLRKRYHENPRRFFAPLANEYRKAGFLDRAILLCQKHLAEQPENMNGLVVFGQALFEAGQLADARDPFASALKLDPENLIALRHLGDIARLEGDAETARGWYLKVLELDRRNSEVLDLLQEVGGDAAEPRSGPSVRPTAAGGLVSVAPSVGMSGTDVDLRGMIDLDPPAASGGTPPTPAAPVKTVVIDAQRLADQDRRESESASAITVPVAAVTPPAPKPAKRASLLDIDFSELREEPSAKPPTPAAPLMSVEAAEYGFAEMEIVGEEDDQPTGMPEGDRAAEHEEPLIEPPVESVSLSTGEQVPAGDLELADFSAEVSPLAGLEATEFESGEAAPLADLDVPDDAPAEVAPLADLDRVDVTVDEVAPLGGLEPTMGAVEPERTPETESSPEPAMLDAELDAIEVPSAEAPISDFASLELPSVDLSSADATPTESAAVAFSVDASDADADAEIDDEADDEADDDEIEEPPSASVRPRMTRADLASLPLLADFGLDDDEEAPPAEPTPRASQRTPTFVTETMAELYLKQGFRTEAINVYRQLIAQQPDDTGLRDRLAALERETSEVPDFEAPTDLSEPEPAAANAVLDDVSFGEVGLRVPSAVTPMMTPLVTPAASGPTAREFFAAFARREAALSVAEPEDAAAEYAELEHAEHAEHAEPETTASEWPLDALFGAATDVRDLHAAETLAGMATFEGPDGGTHIDELLTGESSTPRRSVPRVSESLKFDQFFAAPGATTTPTPPGTPAADDAGDDDLDQFQDWLKGLKP